MRSFTCDRCGWATDEAAADWDRFSKLETCPRCQTRGESLPAALFWGLPRPRSMAGKIIWAVGLIIILSAVAGFLDLGSARPFVTSFGSMAITFWIFRSRPAQPKK